MSAFAPSYARAFFASIPGESDAARFFEGAEEIQRALSADPRVKPFFLSPAVPESAKLGAIEELTKKAGLDDFGRRFFRVLLEHGRLSAVAEILSAIRRESDRRSGVMQAEVTVAASIGADERRSVEEALTRATGRPVRVAVNVDERILAGFVARVGSEIFDASALRAIDRFREAGRKKEE